MGIIMETASEINNDYFEIQSSVNINDWEIKGIVFGSGNTTSPRTYKFIDTSPSEYNVYYRLKQVDYDGKSEIFNTIYLNYFTMEKSINVYPIPLMRTDEINVEITGFKGEEVVLILIDEMGIEFYSKVIISESDSEIHVIYLQNDIPSGMYIIKGSSLNYLYNKKIIIK